MLAFLGQKRWRNGAHVGLLGIGRIVGLLTVAAFVALRVWDPALLGMVRSKIFDAYQRAYPRTIADDPVTIVDIDERSLQALGQWPWSRSVLASLVDRLAAGGAVAIGFDIVFAEPDRLSPRRVAERVADADLRARLQALPDSDAQFAEAVARARVVLGQGGTANS